MFKFYIIVIVTLLLGEISNLAARHIINSLDVDTQISVTVEEKTSSFNMAISHLHEEIVRIGRDTLEVRKNCPCLINGRCSKRTTCS